MSLDKTGFHFMVYQPYPYQEKVRAWIDGDTSYRTYKNEDLIELVPLDMQATMRKTLMDYSMFLWDVEHNNIRRLTYKGKKIPIGEYIKDKKNVHEVVKEETVHDNYWHTDHREAGLIVKK